MIVHLVDGTYELFRHFYGLRRFNKGNDRPYGAVVGVLQTVLQMLEKGATHIGVATDHVIESFRNELWNDYKTGEGIEPALCAQFHPLESALAAMGVVVWPMVELEADDALASAARIAAEDERVEKVCIWTVDKDLAQCVRDDRVVQMDRRANKIFDAQGVRQKFGVEPALIPDFLALVGDAADGYPGVPGIGAVTAARLLNRHGPIEALPPEALGAERDRALLFKTARHAQDRRAALSRCRDSALERPDRRLCGMGAAYGRATSRRAQPWRPEVRSPDRRVAERALMLRGPGPRPHLLLLGRVLCLVRRGLRVDRGILALIRGLRRSVGRAGGLVRGSLGVIGRARAWRWRHDRRGRGRRWRWRIYRCLFLTSGKSSYGYESDCEDGFIHLIPLVIGRSREQSRHARSLPPTAGTECRITESTSVGQRRVAARAPINASRGGEYGTLGSAATTSGLVPRRPSC